MGLSRLHAGMLDAPNHVWGDFVSRRFLNALVIADPVQSAAFTGIRIQGSPIDDNGIHGRAGHVPIADVESQNIVAASAVR